MKKIGTIEVQCCEVPKAERLCDYINMNVKEISDLSEWRGIDGRGNCFFATTHMFTRLYKYGLECVLTTGIFLHDEERIYHAWIEFEFENEYLVFNVSNLHQKPAYIVKREIYYKINNLQETIQVITLPQLKVKLSHYTSKQKNIKDGFDMRSFTKYLLKPTMSKLSRYQKN